jgi:DNA-binding NtrC family response regulator
MKSREPARILVVDDDRENGTFLKEQLGGEDCNVVWFADPREALRLFRRGIYHVAILDLKMPRMSGVDLYKALREKDPDIGLIIQTAYPSVDSALATLKSGAYDYLRKPFKIVDLRNIVHRLLEEKGVFVEAEKVLNQQIGRRIKEARTMRNWTIAKLAHQTALSKSLISQIENAKNSASLYSLVKIARSLRIHLRDLVKDI